MRHAHPVPARDLTRLLRQLIAVVGAVWAVIITAWPAAPFTLTFDDSYYYAEIGRNLAHGAGSTFDQLTTTNGYHPLWMAVSVIPFWLGLDGLAAVRGLLAIQLSMWCGVLWLVVGLFRLPKFPVSSNPERVLVALVLASIGANPFVLKLFVNGLESGITALLAASLLVRSARRGGQILDGGRRDRMITGLLVSLLFLGRTDGILLIGFIGLWALAECRHSPRGLWSVLELLSLPSATVFVYLGSNAFLTGHITQVSGAVKRLPLTFGRVMVFSLILGVALVVVGWSRRRPAADRPARLPRTRYLLATTGWFAGFCIALAGYYLVLQAVPYLWYFAPLALYGLVLALCVAADLSEGMLREAKAGRSAVRALLPVYALIVLPLVLGGALQTKDFVDPKGRALMQGDARAGEWISKNLPADAVIGSYDAGILAYFADQRVVNLDGVVNDFRWLDALRTGRTAAILRAQGLTYLANHGAPVAGDDPDMRRSADRLLGAGSGAGLVLVWHDEFVFTGNFDGARTNNGDKRVGVFVYRVSNR